MFISITLAVSIPQAPAARQSTRERARFGGHLGSITWGPLPPPFAPSFGTATRSRSLSEHMGGPSQSSWKCEDIGISVGKIRYSLHILKMVNTLIGFRKTIRRFSKLSGKQFSNRHAKQTSKTFQSICWAGTRVHGKCVLCLASTDTT